MARVIALAATAPMHFERIEVLRSLIVIGCAVALIGAGAVLPA